MKKEYKGLEMSLTEIPLENMILTSSKVEVDSDVTVKEFKDGFSDLGENGFEINFE